MASIVCTGCGGDAGDGTSLFMGTWLPICEDCALELFNKVKDDPP